MPLLNRQHTLHVLISQPLSLLTGKQLRGLEHIFDLSSIHPIPRQLVQLIIAEAMAVTLSGGIEEVDPNMTSGRCAQLVVLH